MEEMLNNGQLVPFEDISENNYEEYAEAFSEGNEKLKELLLYCFENGIKTIGCCSGHCDRKNNRAYIGFEYCQENIEIISKLMLLLEDSNIQMEFSSYNDKENKPMFWIGSNPENADKLFENALEICKSRQDIVLGTLQQQILKAMDNHTVKNSVFLIRMTKNQRTGMRLYNAIIPYQYNGKKIESEYDYSYTYPNQYLDDKNNIIESGKTIELPAIFEDEMMQLLSVIIQGQEEFRTQAEARENITLQDSYRHSIGISDIEQATSNVRLSEIQQESIEIKKLVEDMLKETREEEQETK